MATPRKKQRQAARRKTARKSVSRRQSISPIKRLAAAPGEVECWATRGFETYGQMSIFIFKRAGGLTGFAAFLIDRGVTGLKDAWTQIIPSRREFLDILQSCSDDEIKVGPIAIEDVRQCVAAAARWAHDNGMRMPKDWLRSTELIGGVGDWATADVSNFVLEFAGHPEDLRQRLVGHSFDDYIRRTDIAFEFSEDAAFKDQATGDYINPLLDDIEAIEELASSMPLEEINALVERFTPSATGLVAETAEWLAGQAVNPSPELFEAWRSILLASTIARAALPESPEQEVLDFSSDLLEDMTQRIAEDRVEEYDRAMCQALDHTKADPLILQNGVLKYGLAGGSADQLD